MKSTEEIMIKMALDGWNAQIKRTNHLLEGLTDDQLQNDVAPNRNSGVYLLGHLAAVHDGMLTLLNISEKLHPDLAEPFIKQADKSGQTFPDVPFLKEYWHKVNSILANSFEKMTPAHWFEKHTAVTDEDFEKEPHRNKLNILLSRTSHLANHLGQLTFLQEKVIVD